jgi:hypothetical protein
VFAQRMRDFVSHDGREFVVGELQLPVFSALKTDSHWS